MSCEVLAELEAVIKRRIEEKSPESYTYRLYSSGVPSIARKVGEEAIEVIVAALAESGRRIVEEAADLLYHVIVLLVTRGLSIADVCAELKGRMKKRVSAE